MAGRTTWARNGQKTIVWRCINRLEQGTKVCKYSPTLREENIEKAIMNVINSVIYGYKDFTETLKGNMRTVIGENTEMASLEDINVQIDTLQKQMLRYVELNAKAGANSKAYDSKFEQISKEIKELQKQKKELAGQEKRKANYTHRANGMAEFLDANCEIVQFDNELVRRLIQSIKVVSREKVVVQFKSGQLVERCIE